MIGRDNAGSNSSEKKMEGEDSVRTVDCLRGRLLAERMASRNAKDEAQHLGNKMIELEKLLKEEAKSRNRAEKKLKMMINKLKSMNISFVSSQDGSEHYSEFGGKSDISSVTSTPTSSKDDENMQNQLVKISSTCENQHVEFQKYPQNLEQIEDQISPESTTFGDFLSNSEKSIQIGSHLSYNDSKMDQQSDIGNGSLKSSNEEGFNQEDDQDLDKNVDNSMALVLVDTPEKIKTVDPEVLDATVKEVLDALRYAKEQLQSSMERRRANMISVG